MANTVPFHVVSEGLFPLPYPQNLPPAGRLISPSRDNFFLLPALSRDWMIQLFHCVFMHLSSYGITSMLGIFSYSRTNFYSKILLKIQCLFLFVFQLQQFSLCQRQWPERSYIQRSKREKELGFHNLSPEDKS